MPGSVSRTWAPCTEAATSPWSCEPSVCFWSDTRRPLRMASRLGVAVVEPNDVEAMVAVLEAVWSDGGVGLRRRQTAVDYRDLAASVSSLLGAVAVMPSYLPPLRRQ